MVLGDIMCESQPLALHPSYGTRAKWDEIPVKITSTARSLEEMKYKQQCLSFIIKMYGCQMNFTDSEVVRAILLKDGYMLADMVDAEEFVLVKTCAVCDNAEAKVWNRIESIRQPKLKLLLLKQKDVQIMGALGCMAERLKKNLLGSDDIVDLVVGPDAYRNLTNLMRVCTAVGKMM